MNVFNCHDELVPDGRRSPASIAYKPGKFLDAELLRQVEERGLDNDAAAAPARWGDRQAEVGVVQIAGLVARRIVCFSREGEKPGGRPAFPG